MRSYSVGSGGGFTFIELMLAMGIVALVFAVSLPVSIGVYNRYAASLEAEKVLVLMVKTQREAFLYGEVREVASAKGVITVDGIANPLESGYAEVAQPILFFSNGTSSGGRIVVKIKSLAFMVEVKSPLGEIAFKEL